MLAADQDTVAIGVQKSRSRMRVRLISTTGRAIAAPVLLPDGYLALDGRRLLVSTPTVGAFPLEPRYDVGFGFVQYGGVETSPVDTNGVYRVSEYSVRGRLVRRFGTSATQPLVSHRAMIVSAIAADGNETMTLRSLITGVSRPLIGFSDPGRELMTATFTWPALTLVDTTSAALPDGQFTCTNGTFSAPTPPTLVELNVIHTPFMRGAGDASSTHPSAAPRPMRTPTAVEPYDRDRAIGERPWLTLSSSRHALALSAVTVRAVPSAPERTRAGLSCEGKTAWVAAHGRLAVREQRPDACRPRAVYIPETTAVRRLRASTCLR